MGNVLKHNSFLSFKGKTLGKRTKGRPRTSFFRSVINTMNFESYGVMKKRQNDVARS